MNTTFCLILHYNNSCEFTYNSSDNSYLFVDGKEIFKFKADNKNVNFPAQLCLGIISNRFRALESRGVSLN